MEDFEQLINAIKYALEEMESYRIDYAVAEADRCRCPVSLVDGVYDELSNKMNEWAEFEDLPEDFWYDEFDDEDVVYIAYDIIHEQDE